MKVLIALLIRWVARHTGLTIGLTLGIAALSLGYAGSHLGFDTNQDNLISPKADYFQRYKAFLKEFGDWEYVYVVIQVNNSPAAAKAFAKKLSERLRQKPALFPEVTERIAIDKLKNAALLLLPENEFTEFAKVARAQAPTLQQFLSLQSSADWYHWLAQLLSQPNKSLDTQRLATLWPLLKDGVAAPFDAAALKRFELPRLLQKLTGRYADNEGYFFSENGQLLFLQILPQKDFTRMDIIHDALVFLRGEIAALKADFPELDVGVTGKPVLQNDEADSTGIDSVFASIGSFLMVTLLFILFVKDWRLTIMSLLALLAGIAWMTGFVAAVFGSVNLLTIVFAVILIGMGMDYGVHFLLHYQLLRESGRDVRAAVISALEENGVAILLGAGLTALGFTTAVFADFLGLKQLGLIVGIGIVVCCLLQLTLFPALILKGHPREKSHHNILSRFAFLIALCHGVVRRPRLILLFTTLITLAAIPLMTRVGFDYNLLRLQDQTQESVRYEKVIEEKSDVSTSFLAVMRQDPNELRRLRAEIEKLPTVARTESLDDLIPRDPANRLAELATLRPLLLPAFTAGKSNMGAALTRLQAALDGLINQAFSAGDTDAVLELQELSERLTAYGKSLATTTKATPPHEKAFRQHLRELQSTFLAALSPQPLTEADLPPELLRRYKGPNGYYALTIYPQGDVWEWDALEHYLSGVRAIAPDATGAPVTTYESAVRMNAGFKRIGLFTSLIVFVLLIIAFRELKTPLVITLSLVLTFLALFAFMGAVNIDINLANFFALPILIGSNVDHGVYVFHHYREHKSLEKLFQLTVPPIFLSCFTNVVGFASLALVRHRGLSGFGLIMSVGTFFSLLITIVWLPSVIRVFYEKKN